MFNKEEKKSLSRLNSNIFNLLVDLTLSVVADS